VIVDGREDLPEVIEDMSLVEHRLKDGRMPNSGVWRLRSSDLTRAFLAQIWAQEDLIEHRWWENAAICRLFGYSLDPVGPGAPTEWLEHVSFLDPRWNSIPDARAARPRIRHYPGYSPRTRRALMTRDVSLLEVNRRLGRA
jgi:hypothetical protein